MKLSITQIISAAVLFISAASCTVSGWSREELSLINQESTVMRVLTVDDPGDLKVLRRSCIDIPEECIASEEYRRLSAGLVATVTDSTQDGVGIAGPQVGISRRVVAVQRLDKEGEPFEVYPNIRITAMRGKPVEGPEGCLSVPGRRGNVLRSRDIDISYTSPATLRDTTETILGFTAVIFQHECDHLDGIIYTDKLCSDGR